MSNNLNFDYSTTKSKKLLILEDMKDTRERLVADVKELGYQGEIIQCETLQEAKAALQNDIPDYIISDWNLPDGTGLSFLEEVKGNFRVARKPFIMCTTEDEVNNILDAIKKGASEYIVKPWDKTELKSKLESTFFCKNSKT